MGNGNLTPQDREIARLKRENEILRHEKKQSAYSQKHPDKIYVYREI